MPDVVVDETWFSDPEICRKSKAWYMLSKTLAEEAAWNFANEKGIDMVVINPEVVIGPLLQPTLNTSSAEILNLIDETSHSRPHQRVGGSIRFDTEEEHTETLLHRRHANHGPQIPKCKVSTVRSKSLGIEYTSRRRRSLEETVESLKEKGFICF
ncbi:hypothetical protein MLD38_017164 [Melastoma candidum]|nr:hypothetical protein MLD38_017164 [Melastoma candidum]